MKNYRSSRESLIPDEMPFLILKNGKIKKIDDNFLLCLKKNYLLDYMYLQKKICNHD
jgi:hypothetical protein